MRENTVLWRYTFSSKRGSPSKPRMCQGFFFCHLRGEDRPWICPHPGRLRLCAPPEPHQSLWVARGIGTQAATTPLTASMNRLDNDIGASCRKVFSLSLIPKMAIEGQAGFFKYYPVQNQMRLKVGLYPDWKKSQSKLPNLEWDPQKSKKNTHLRLLY